MTTVSFIELERSLGRVFEQLVADNLLTAGKEERALAIAQGDFNNGVPAITVAVDGGWSKRSHKHSYNAKSGVGVIFEAATKKLLFIGAATKIIFLILWLQPTLKVSGFFFSVSASVFPLRVGLCIELVVSEHSAVLKFD